MHHLSSHHDHALLHMTKSTLMMNIQDVTTSCTMIQNLKFHSISFLNHIGGWLLSCEHNNTTLRDISNMMTCLHKTPFHHTFAKVYGKYSYTFSLFPILIFMNTSIGIKHHIISYPIPSPFHLFLFNSNTPRKCHYFISPPLKVL